MSRCSLLATIGCDDGTRATLDELERLEEAVLSGRASDDERARFAATRQPLRRAYEVADAIERGSVLR